MMIKGKISQIIQKGKVNNFLSNSPDIPIWDFKDKYIITIVNINFPDNYFKRVIYNFKNRKNKFVYTIALNKCNYKIGDVIKMNVKPYYKKTEMYIKN